MSAGFEDIVLELACDFRHHLGKMSGFQARRGSTCRREESDGAKEQMMQDRCHFRPSQQIMHRKGSSLFNQRPSDV